MDDWIEFRVSGAADADNDALNALLDQLRPDVAAIREHSKRWKQELAQRDEAASAVRVTYSKDCYYIKSLCMHTLKRLALPRASLLAKSSCWYHVTWVPCLRLYKFFSRALLP